MLWNVEGRDLHNIISGSKTSSYIMIEMFSSGILAEGFGGTFITLGNRSRLLKVKFSTDCEREIKYFIMVQ